MPELMRKRECLRTRRFAAKNDHRQWGRIQTNTSCPKLGQPVLPQNQHAHRLDAVPKHGRYLIAFADRQVNLVLNTKPHRLSSDSRRIRWIRLNGERQILGKDGWALTEFLN